MCGHLPAKDKPCPVRATPAAIIMIATSARTGAKAMIMTYPKPHSSASYRTLASLAAVVSRTYSTRSCRPDDEERENQAKNSHKRIADRDLNRQSPA